MEKRRRARINHCLMQLKAMIIDDNQELYGSRTKLEKADILEITVAHLRHLHHRGLHHQQQVSPDAFALKTEVPDAFALKTEVISEESGDSDTNLQPSCPNSFPLNPNSEDSFHLSANLEDSYPLNLEDSCPLDANIEEPCPLDLCLNREKIDRDENVWRPWMLFWTHLFVWFKLCRNLWERKEHMTCTETFCMYTGCSLAPRQEVSNSPCKPQKRPRDIATSILISIQTAIYVYLILAPYFQLMFWYTKSVQFVSQILRSETTSNTQIRSYMKKIYDIFLICLQTASKCWWALAIEPKSPSLPSRHLRVLYLLWACAVKWK